LPIRLKGAGDIWILKVLSPKRKLKTPIKLLLNFKKLDRLTVAASDAADISGSRISRQAIE
jgi:hypothetical protein